jgi:hypothetical protein
LTLSPIVGLDGRPQPEPAIQVVRCLGLTDCDDLATAASRANAFLDLADSEDPAHAAQCALYRSLVSLERDKSPLGAAQGDWLLTYIEVRRL